MTIFCLAIEKCGRTFLFSHPGFNSVLMMVLSKSLGLMNYLFDLLRLLPAAYGNIVVLLAH
jgi:hypothetical protein